MATVVTFPHPPGMTAGVIPVVLNRGGVGDIVHHGYNGFMASSPEALADMTVNVFNLDRNVTTLLQQHAIESTKQFYQSAFIRKFHVLVYRGLLTKPFRHLVNVTRGEAYGVLALQPACFVFTVLCDW